MGYDFTIKNGVRVKKDGKYPWPALRCVPPEPDRTIYLYTDDVLTRSEDGTYMKHTGLGCFNIVLRDDEVEPICNDSHLRLL